MVKPIKPSEIAQAKVAVIPEAVIQVVNDILARRFTNGRASIKQKEIVNELVCNHNMTTDMIYSNGYLNFEEIYREQGWDVVYDKPAYYETYDSVFKFKPAENS